MNFKIIYFSLIFFFFIDSDLNAQGCSDAGICTVNGLLVNPANNVQYKNKINVGMSFGIGDYNAQYIAPHLEYTRYFGDKWSLDLRLTAIATYYKLVDKSGNFSTSDSYLQANYLFSKNSKVTVGLKTPFMSGMFSGNDGYDLPLNYQPSLGTTDLILGASHQWKNLFVSLGYQQALTKSPNEFLSNRYEPGDPLYSYPSSYHLSRKGDIMLRSAYLLPVNKMFTLTPGFTGIYHVANDTYTLGNNEIELKGSKGLTLNANLFMDVFFKEKYNVQVYFGTPLVVRDLRPDGLTRKFVVGLDYKFLF